MNIQKEQIDRLFSAFGKNPRPGQVMVYMEWADKVDENIILTDEFAFIFEKCFRGAAENYQKEKLDSFRWILVNSAIGGNLEQEEKEYFLNIVNTLSVLHIRILKFMARPIVYVR